MLIKYYSPQEHNCLNHEGLIPPTPSLSTIPNKEALKFKNIPYTTTSLDIFDNLLPAQLNVLFEEQKTAAIKEADLLLKYSYLTKTTHQKTVEQYNHLFFYESHTYLKTEIISYITRKTQEDNTYINSPPPQSQEQSQTKDNTVFVSRDAIRNITGYSYYATPEWDETKTEVYIKWQHYLLEDQHEIIVVDGSRQMGKSYTLAEKLIEESHIPNNDTLIGAFLEKTTNVIRNYILRLIKKFPPDYFTHFKKDGYIINNHTMTKIYFRTLSDGGDNCLGLTLRRIIIDEAQFVPESTFEDALLPTIATTGGQLIMIGTPSRDTSGYMYKTIMQIKRGELSSEVASYYKISADENPFLHPRTRANINRRRTEPAIMRQYFNSWGDIGDNLFHITETDVFPALNIEDNFFVFGIDPARMNDRSGNSLLYVQQNKITIIQSGFVPDSHKSQWELQGKFYSRFIEGYQKAHPQYKPQINIHPSSKWYNVMDVSGVGDGVSNIFRNEGIKLSAMIRYTGGVTESDDGINYKVSKTILINNFLDLCQENNIEVYTPTNKYLLEEISYIEEAESRAGTIMMKSKFFDDITNATLIAAYFVVKRRLLGRVNTTINTESPFKRLDHMEAIEQSRKPELSSQW